VAEELKEQHILPVEYDNIEDEITQAFGKKLVFAFRDMWRELVLKINPLIKSYYSNEGDFHNQNTDTKIIDGDGDTQVYVGEDYVRMKVANVDAFDLDLNGILALAKQSGSRAIASSSQALAAGVSEDLELDSVTDSFCFDQQGEFDTGQHDHTVTDDGIYLAVGNLGINALDDDQGLAGWFTVNDSYSAGRVFHASPGANNDLCFPTVDVMKLDANDYIKLRIQCSQALNTAVGGYRCYMAVVKLA